MFCSRLYTRAHHRRSAGFTLVEALVSITIAAMASGALYLGLMGSLQATQYALEQAIATGIAEQLLDEAMGTTYVGGLPIDPYQAVLGPNAYEAAGAGRERYSDADDYTGVITSPPKDMYGVVLGSDDGSGSLRHTQFRARTDFTARWTEEIEVYYVSETDPSQKVTTAPYSGLRAIEVRIYNNETGGARRLITTLRRVHGYVPPPL